MKAAQFSRFGSPSDVIECVELPDPPPPGEGEVALRMLAMPINPADLLTIEGGYGVKPPLPFIPGAEGVGRVEAVGSGVGSVRVGDLVMPFARSSWRERMVCGAETVVPLPPTVEAEQAAMLKVNPATAELMLTTIVPLKPGEWLIQNAANSAVGRFLVRLARRRDIRTVNLVRRPEPVEALRADGADVVIVDDGSDPARLAAAVEREAGTVPIRLGIDAIAGSSTNALAACLAEGGRLVNYGLLSGRPCEVDPYHLVFRDIRLRGFWLAQWFKETPPDEVRALYARLASLMAKGELRTEIEARYPLERVAEAVAHAGRGGRGGKILLQP